MADCGVSLGDVVDVDDADGDIAVKNSGGMDTSVVHNIALKDERCCY